jgi:hypothetical protein
MAIGLTCECGKKLAVKEELAGKRVKCPACESLITVPPLSGEPPPLKRSAAPIDDDAERDDDEERPRKKKKKKRPAKSNKLLWIGATVGVLMLGFCCIGGGVAGWWFFLRGGPEKPILGRWGIDVEATKNNNPLMRDMFKAMPPPAKAMAEKALSDELSKVVIEIKADGNLSITGIPNSAPGKWKNATAKGDIVTIEAKIDRPGEGWERIEIKVLDATHLQMTPTNQRGFNNGPLWLKRL